MGYKVLVTLDLKNTSDDEREKFYEVLEQEKWKKIKSLTTSWKVSFNDDFTYEEAIKTIKNDLKKAKKDSKASDVEYAFQLNKEKVLINKI